MLAAASSPDAVMEARIDGTLMRSADGCLGIDVAGDFTVVLFPYGAQLSKDGMSVAVAEVGDLQFGDNIVGGGGYISSVDVPEPCRGGAEIVVWQTVD